tara:strand:+ start:399 stop:1379 length:981 start_codon:yes stop_codon:yes gene_type:complete
MPQLSDLKNKKNTFQKKSYRSYKTEPNLMETNPLSAPPLQPTETVKKIVSTQSEDETIFINHNKCRPWMFADRNEHEMGNIEELANSIKANGQEVPALVRKLENTDGNIEYEVIYGHRRWKACTLINKPLKAKVKNLDNKEAAVAQILENYNREDLSDYSKSINYSKLLKEKTFTSKTELAAYVGIPRTTVNDIMSFSEIPEKLIKAFINPEKLATRSAVSLSSLCKELSGEQFDLLCDMAPSILNGSIPFKKINISLFHKESSPFPSSSTQNKRIFNNDMNVKLFTSGLNQNKAPSLTFHKIVIDNDLLPEIEDLVLKFLKDKTE